MALTNFGNGSMENFGVRLDPRVGQGLREIAAKRGVSVGQAAREMLTAAIDGNSDLDEVNDHLADLERRVRKLQIAHALGIEIILVSIGKFAKEDVRTWIMENLAGDSSAAKPSEKQDREGPNNSVTNEADLEQRIPRTTLTR